jgi:hypothetical protein
MSCSGGEAGPHADMLVGPGVSFPPLTDAQRAGLREALGAHVALANPLDYHTFVWGDRAAIAQVLHRDDAGHLSLGVVVLDFPRPIAATASAWEIVIDACADATAATGTHGDPLDAARDDAGGRGRDLAARGIVPLCGVDDGSGGDRGGRAARAGAVAGPVLIPAVADPVRAPASERGGGEGSLLAALRRGIPRMRAGDKPEAAADAGGHGRLPGRAQGAGSRTSPRHRRRGAEPADAAAVEALPGMAGRDYLVEEMVEVGWPRCWSGSCAIRPMASC